MRLFGTNGVRGISNEDMNPELAMNLGKAIGTWLQEADTVALARDPRTSGDMLSSAVVSGLMSTGVDVVDVGMVPTPAMQYYVKHRGLDAGIMITASHNPPQFNGIKVVAGDGTELPREEEEKIEKNYFERSFRMVSWDRVGKMRKDVSSELYVDGIISSVKAESIRKRGFTVVLDCANGASTSTSPMLLRKLGCRVISLNAQPDGMFPGHDSEPSPENLRALVEAVKSTGADIGIAHDGDADRVVFVDEKGNYLYGDRSLAIMSRYMVENEGVKTVVTPVSSSTAVEDVVNAGGGSVVYTRVGAPIVARRMIEIGASFGGEENGGLIFGKHQFCRDGAMGAAKMLELMAETGKTLSELDAEIPRYSLYKTKTSCPDEMKEKVLEKLAEIYEKEGRVDRTDGLKVYSDEGWVLIRPSGTEPIYRIFAESKKPETAKELAEKGRKNIDKIVNGFE